MTDWGVTRMFGREGGGWDYFGHHLSVTEFEQQSYRNLATVDPLELRAFDYESFRSYSSMTYAKTTLVLRTMESYLGNDKFEAAMRHYYEKARFTHPRGEDFVRLFDEGARQDLTWFWRPALWGTQTLDYQILRIDKRRKQAPVGLFDENGERVEKKEPKKPDQNAPWISEVVVHRKGDIAIPVDVKVVFEDGSEKRETWDGGSEPGAPRWKRFVYETAKAVAYAEIDPDGKVALDANRWNNGKRAESDGGPRRRVVGWFQNALSLLFSSVGF